MTEEAVGRLGTSGSLAPRELSCEPRGTAIIQREYVPTYDLKQRILIDGDIRVTVLAIRGNQVRIGIEAPGAVKVVREELLVDAEALAWDPEDPSEPGPSGDTLVSRGPLSRAVVRSRPMAGREPEPVRG